MLGCPLRVLRRGRVWGRRARCRVKAGETEARAHEREAKPQAQLEHELWGSASLRARRAGARCAPAQCTTVAPARVSRAARRMTSGRTAVLMADNRPPIATAPTARTLTYPSLAFAINAEYSCRHGYDLLYFQMASPRCAHPTQGEREASYCKLPAIAAALADGYERVVFIDSDSFFLHRNESLPELLQRYRPPLNRHAGPAHTAHKHPRMLQTTRCARRRRAPPDPAVWFASDLPQLGDRPNGGFHVWARDRGSRRVLRTWWHLRGGGYNRVHDFEQHSLQWALGHLAGARALLGTLQLKAMDDAFHHAVAHVDHTKSERRLWLMSIELLEAALEHNQLAPGRGALGSRPRILPCPRPCPLPGPAQPGPLPGLARPGPALPCPALPCLMKLPEEVGVLSGVLSTPAT